MKPYFLALGLGLLYMLFAAISNYAIPSIHMEWWEFAIWFLLIEHFNRKDHATHQNDY